MKSIRHRLGLFVDKRAHEVGHVVADIGYKVADIERAAVRRVKNGHQPKYAPHNDELAD